MSAAPTAPDENTPHAAQTPLAQLSSDTTALTPRDWGDKVWKGAFLEALSRTRNASAAARAVGCSRQYAYEERDADPEFKLAWQEAITVGVEFLEQVAHTRATVGEQRRVVRTRTRRDAQGNVIEVEETVEESRRVSDALLRDQLRAAKPEVYGDRQTVRHVGFEDGPVQVELGPRKRTAERVAELLAIAREEGLLPPADAPELPPASDNGA